MDLLKTLGLFTILILNLSYCSSSAEYVIFPGFDVKSTKPTTPIVTSATTKITTTTQRTTTTHTTARTTTKRLEKKVTTAKSTSTVATTTTTTQDPLFTYSPYKPYVCPEEEKPLNIGPYEVPTQKDLVVHMRTTLLKKFKSYHRKVLYFLDDITKATRATSQVEKNCLTRSKNTYKLCVRHVSNQCQVITKSLATSLERQRHDVSAFTGASICNVSSMKADPVQLIKTIAMEEASLEFALPGFLRLLGACSVYCQSNQHEAHWKKPKRHMSDQDLVIKHFLTRKNYAQLVKGTL